MFCKAFKMRNFYWLRSFNRNGQFILKFRSAHTASTQMTESEIELLTKQDPRVSESLSGATVASVENYSPVSQVSVIVKAGSVYESPQNLGVVHCLRNAATLSTRNQTGFSITRNLEVKGSKLNIVSTREHIIYTLQCVRDEIDSGLAILADVSTNLNFKRWEIEDLKYRMALDLALLQTNSEGVLMEALHKAAFRGGLSNSLYSPSFMVGKHSNEMLEEFARNYITAPRTSIVGLGVCHDHLQSSVDALFDLNNTPGSEASTKFGSGDVRLEADIPDVHTAIVAEGSGLLNTKDVLSLGALQCILGSGTISKLGSLEASKLGEVASKSTKNPHAVSCLNINYANTGLFGVYIRGAPNDMKDLVKSVVTQMRDTSKNITEADVQTAKHKLKAKLHLERDNSSDLFYTMAVETSIFGNIRDIKDIEKAIDDLKVSDITSIAAKVLKAKPAMASLGRLHATPHLDEVISI